MPGTIGCVMPALHGPNLGRELDAVADADTQRAPAQRAREVEVCFGIPWIHLDGPPRERFARSRVLIAAPFVPLDLGEIDLAARRLPERLVVRRVGADRGEVVCQRLVGLELRVEAVADHDVVARRLGGSAGADQKAGSQLSAKDKAERCTKARERYDQYMSSQRLYSQDDKGQRTYLSDKELTEARANAKASMDALCQ